MKLKHENILLIDKWLTDNRIIPSLDDSFVRETYSAVLEQHYSLDSVISPKARNRFYRLQYDFVRRDLLKIMYMRNGKSASGIPAGFVYAIGNPAWEGHIKVGSAIDVVDRLASYQTSSPFRDYYLIDYYFAHDRLAEEANVHCLFDRNSEWCKVSLVDIKAIFKERRERSHVKLTDEILFKHVDKDKYIINSGKISHKKG